jgi:hypothetical protein
MKKKSTVSTALWSYCGEKSYKNPTYKNNIGLKSPFHSPPPLLSLFLFLSVLGIELKASCLLGKNSTTWPPESHPQSFLVRFLFQIKSYAFVQTSLLLREPSTFRTARVTGYMIPCSAILYTFLMVLLFFLLS